MTDLNEPRNVTPETETKAADSVLEQPSKPSDPIVGQGTEAIKPPTEPVVPPIEAQPEEVKVDSQPKQQAEAFPSSPEVKPSEGDISFGYDPKKDDELTVSKVEGGTESPSAPEPVTPAPEPSLGENSQGTNPWSADPAVRAKDEDPVAPADSPQTPKSEEPKADETEETAGAVNPTAAPLAKATEKKPWWKFW